MQTVANSLRYCVGVLLQFRGGLGGFLSYLLWILLGVRGAARGNEEPKAGGNKGEQRESSRHVAKMQKQSIW